MKINKNYLKVGENYLFSSVIEKTNAFKLKNPNKEIIKLSVGDVTRPLCKCVVQAMKNACDEMGEEKTFRGYGFEPGYLFLRQAISKFYLSTNNVLLEPDEILISDGAKSDISNILDIFDTHCMVSMCDPVYPVYLETNLMLGRKPKFFNATKENNFTPLPNKKVKADIIYICNPANPTGTAYTLPELKQWVDFAIKHKSVILYDAAYQCFVDDGNIARSIYQLDGAKTCAIEICSLSKMAGFTGVRCGYTVVPKQLKCGAISLNKLWARRQVAKFNGVSYIVQRGAEAVFSEKGLEEIKSNIDYYKKNVSLICSTLDKLKIFYAGGKNSPYIWMQCPSGMTSWEFFDYLLENAGVVCTPGEGFGKNGKNFVRLTGFNTYQNTVKACKKLEKYLREKY